MSRMAKEKKPISIDVEPFLSIMAIVLKLISLILVVTVLRIALNPKRLKIINLGLFSSSHNETQLTKIPSYIDCYEDKVKLYPGDTSVTPEELQQPDNPVEKLLDKIEANKDKQYVVLMVRPHSVKNFRTVRNMIGKRPIDIGKDVVDAKFQVKWDEAKKALGVTDTE
jgi:hypothetical protein